MSLNLNQDIYNALKDLKVIDRAKLDNAYRTSREEKIQFTKVLLEKDLISDDNLGRIISEILNLPLVRLSQMDIPNDILAIIPEIVAKKQKIIAFKKDQNNLHLAMSDPDNLEIIEFIQKKTGLQPVIYYATEQEINNAFALYSKNVQTAFDDIISQNIKQAKQGAENEPPIINIVDTIVSYAYQNKASDIHVEPMKEKSIVRFRIDGILHDIINLPLDLHQRIVTRIKVLSKLRTDEHQAPQDGKFQEKIEDEDLDIRVSIVPSTHGEKIVMRLLSERSRQFSLIDLGLESKDMVKVKKAYKKPYGMILSTGPTGSGKTTTMYAILKLLNERDVNIMTIEDPVEYEIQGITQIQVNPKTNLTFANGLRSILRQDPNIILVGEIRDKETSDIAVNSAMTGHLVLSTLHTNDATTAIPRLIDMDIEPFLIASTVNIIIAQRLIRKIHSVCRVSQETNIEDVEEQIGHEITKKIFGSAKKVRTYHGKGCKLDHFTGYEDRIGIFEVLVIDDEIREAIQKREDSETIRKIAIKNGMTTMHEDGLEKVKQGLTTFEEVIRVTKE